MSKNLVLTEDQQTLHLAKEVLQTEAAALVEAADRLSGSFLLACQKVLACSGKVVVTGLGKSGHIARKISATLSSTGTPACFLHPSEALHGDLGLVSSGDVLIAIAYGGETTEVLQVVKHAKRRDCTTIAITGALSSSLSRLADITLDGSVRQEAGPLRLAPTASSTVALGLGDALAMCVLKLKGYSETDFAEIHPGGSIGKKLSRAIDVMQKITHEDAFVTVNDDLLTALEAVGNRNFGIVAVVEKDSALGTLKLVGALSDGDVRRALRFHKSAAFTLKVSELMSQTPKTVTSNTLCLEAFSKMEKFKITSVFVLSEEKSDLVGILRMHDLLEAKVI
jgi:arabinose-5-phosphate isomerase